MIPFALTTANGRSKQLNAQRIINMFPERALPGSVSEWVLRSCPGLSTFSEVESNAVRGLHKAVFNGAETLFCVSGTSLYEVDSSGTATLRGSAGTITGTGRVSMASNLNDELVITNSSGTGWVWDDSSLAALSGVDADFTDDATNVTFLDQYIIYGKSGTGQVYASDLNNAQSWNPLSFGTAEAASDNLVEVVGFAGNLYLFGVDTTEVYYNSGASPFAFQRLGGVVFPDIGGTANTAAAVDMSLYWLGSDNIVYRATNMQPQRISTHDVENAIRSRTGLFGWTYKDEGHAFYVLGSDQGALVYDAATNMWHERQSVGNVDEWRANSHAWVYGKHIVGDANVGRLYDMSLDYYVDGPGDLIRTVTSATLYSNGDRRSSPWLQVHFDYPERSGAAFSLLAPTAFEVKSSSGSNLALEATTNVLVWSEDFTKVDWGFSGIDFTVADDATDPLGTTLADRVVSFGDFGDYLYQLYTPGGAISQVPWTFSCYVRAQSGTTARLGMRESGGATGARTVAGTSAFATDGSIARYEMTITPNASDRTTLELRFWSLASTIMDIDVWGAQLEAASAATAYLKSEGTAATRAAGPTLVGVDSGGVTIDTSGWYPSESAILLAGDEIYLTIDGVKKPYVVASDVSSDASGLAEVPVTESLYKPGQGQDPKVMLRWSNDAGKTWSSERWRDLPETGQYGLRTVWRRLGGFYKRVYELSYSEPTSFTIFGADL